MSSFVSKKIEALPPSGIRRFFDLALNMTGVLSLGVGEPDFATPWNIREEAIFSLEKRRTAYTENAGLMELRTLICKYMRDKFDLTYAPNGETLVTVGASEGIDVVLRAILEAGDEVLVVEPCFVAYKPCVVMAGGIPVPVEASPKNDFKVTVADIKAKITAKTKAILLCYPNNPTGAIMTEGELKALAEYLSTQNILVISDEIYAELTYGTKHVSIASFPNMREKTVVLNGFSKAFAMTGWRLGFACGPKDIISAMTKIHQYVAMSAPTIAQYAGIEALKNGDKSVVQMKTEYDARRRFMLREFARIGISCFEAKGAFYLFPYIGGFGLTSEEFCGKLLTEKKLAVVPGTAFGACGEGYVRCSYAYSIEAIKEALARLEEFVKGLKKA